jgi:pyruvate-formate lyase
MTKNPIATNSWLLQKILQCKRSLMQPILGCNNKYGNEQKRKCNQFFVARVNIATTLLVALGFIATKH